MRRILLLSMLLISACISAYGQATSSTARHIFYGTTLPTTCSPGTGDVFWKTAATIGPYSCLTANVWTYMISSGAPSGPASADLSGSYPGPTVAKIQGLAVKSSFTCASNGYILTWVTANTQFECLANGGASGSVTTSGLATNTLPKATGSTSLGDSLITDNGTTVSVNANLSIKAKPLIIELPNSSTGTTNNKLAKIVNTAGVLQAQIITTSSADQTSALGCVISGGGTSGTALIMVAGTGPCYFDSATTAGHIAIPSSTSAGALHDTGSASSPSSGEVVATVGATDACGSPPCLIAGNLFMTPDLVAIGSNGNGGGNGNGNNGAKQQGHKVTLLFNGGSSALNTGDLALFPGSGAYTGTINRMDVSGAGAAGVACSATADIWKRNAAIPTSAQKISASAPATLSAANLSQDAARTSWVNTTVAANDVWSATLATNTGCVSFMVEIYYQ